MKRCATCCGRNQTIVQQHRARQQLKMFLLRQNIRYVGKTSWTAVHLRYLAQVKLPFAEQQFVFQEMVGVITEAGQRLDRYASEIPWWCCAGGGNPSFAR